MSKVMEEVDTQKVSHEVGTHALLELAKLRDEFEIVGDVRGKGLMIGVEMVTDKVCILLALSVHSDLSLCFKNTANG